VGQAVRVRVARGRLTGDWYARCPLCMTWEGTRTWRQAMGLAHAHLISDRHVAQVQRSRPPVPSWAWWGGGSYA
jgi:hypothetical protein